MDIVLDEPTVSGRHIRLEVVPCGKGKRQHEFRCLPYSGACFVSGSRCVATRWTASAHASMQARLAAETDFSVLIRRAFPAQSPIGLLHELSVREAGMCINSESWLPPANSHKTSILHNG